MSVTFSWSGAKENEQVNLANVNARKLLGLIGLRLPPGCGQIEAADLALRATYFLVAIHSHPDLDAGFPSITTQIPGGGIFIDCGWHAGYITDRLTRLRDLAQAAGEYPIEYY